MAFFDITKYIKGEVVQFFGHGSNTSGGTYNGDTGELYTIQNNTKLIRNYAADRTTLIRTITPNNINGGADFEGLAWMDTNRYSISIETGTSYVIAVIVIPDGVVDLAGGDITVEAVYTLAAQGADSNSGLEGICFDPVNQIWYGVGEGEQAATPRRFFKVLRPGVLGRAGDTTTNYTYTDPELVVTEPWDPEVAFANLGATGAQFDLSDIMFHQETGQVLITSHFGDAVIQVDPVTGAVLHNLPVTELTQMEGIAWEYATGNILLIGEPDEHMMLTKPADGDLPIISKIPNATIAHGETFTYTPTASQGESLFWFKEYGPDAMTVQPDTGEISWDTTNLPRGQGIKVGIGCSNEEGEYTDWFVIHVDNTGTSKIVVLGTDTVSPYIRIGALEANFLSGDTLIIPDEHYYASVTADNSYENSFADAFGGDMPAGIATQLTTIIAQTFTVIDSAPHDAVPRQDEALEILGDQCTPQPYVKFSGIEWIGGNRQSIRSQAENNVMELCGAADSGYAVEATTFLEAAAPFGSVAAGYLSGTGSVWENSYAYGDFRYGLQFGNGMEWALTSRCIVRLDHYGGDQPYGGITNYAIKNSGTFSNFVVDGDHQHLAPFYKNYAGCFAFPATGLETYPTGQHFIGNCVYNCDMVAYSSDADSTEATVTGKDFVVYKSKGTVTPQTGSTSPNIIKSDSPLEFSNMSFGKISTYTGAFTGVGYIRAADSSNVLNLSDSLFFDLGWNGTSVDNVGDLFVSTAGPANRNSFDNGYNSGFTGTVNSDGTWLVTNLATADPTVNGWNYLFRVEEGSPLASAGIGADMTTFKCPSNVMPQDLGWKTATTVWAWPHPAEQYITSRMRQYSKTGLPVRNATVGVDPVDFTGTLSGDRGTCATGDSFSEKLWGELGFTVPPLRVSAKPASGNSVTFYVGKYRSFRGNTVYKFNVYETSDMVNPVLTFSGLQGTLLDVSIGVHEYVIRAVDTSKPSSYSANEIGESGNSRKLTVTLSGLVEAIPPVVIQSGGIGTNSQIPFYPFNTSVDGLDRALLVCATIESSGGAAITSMTVGGQALTLFTPTGYVGPGATFSIVAGYILEADLVNVVSNAVTFVGASPGSSNIVIQAVLLEGVDVEALYTDTQEVGWDIFGQDNTESITFTLDPVEDSIGVGFFASSVTSGTWGFDTYTQLGTATNQGANTQGVMATKTFETDVAAEDTVITNTTVGGKLAMFAVNIKGQPGLGDLIPPVVTAPADIEIEFPNGNGGLAQNDSSLLAWLATASAVDETSPATPTVTSNIASLGDPIAEGIHVVTFQATDDWGNIGQDTAQLTVSEAVLPRKVDIALKNDAGEDANGNTIQWQIKDTWLGTTSDSGTTVLSATGTATLSPLNAALGPAWIFIKETTTDKNVVFPITVIQ